MQLNALSYLTDPLIDSSPLTPYALVRPARLLFRHCDLMRKAALPVSNQQTTMAQPTASNYQQGQPRAPPFRRVVFTQQDLKLALGGFSLDSKTY